MVFGILLILSIMDSTLAAPISAKEKHPDCDDKAHIQRDMVTVLEEKRGGEVDAVVGSFEKLGLGDSHASSSSALPAPEHGPTNDGQVPALNPVSSTANPQPLVKPSPDFVPTRGGGWSYWLDGFPGAGVHQPDTGSAQVGHGTLKNDVQRPPPPPPPPSQGSGVALGA